MYASCCVSACITSPRSAGLGPVSAVIRIVVIAMSAKVNSVCFMWRVCFVAVFYSVLTVMLFVVYYAWFMCASLKVHRFFFLLYDFLCCIFKSF